MDDTMKINKPAAPYDSTISSTYKRRTSSGLKRLNNKVSPTHLKEGLISTPDELTQRSAKVLSARRVEQQGSREKELFSKMLQIPELSSSTKVSPEHTPVQQAQIVTACDSLKESLMALQFRINDLLTTFQEHAFNCTCIPDEDIEEYLDICDIYSEYIVKAGVADCGENAMLLAMHLISNDYSGVCVAQLVDSGDSPVIPDHATVLVGVTPDDLDAFDEVELDTLPDHILIADRWLGTVSSPKAFLQTRDTIMKHWAASGVRCTTHFRKDDGDYYSKLMSPDSPEHALPKGAHFQVIPVGLDFYGVDV